MIKKNPLPILLFFCSSFFMLCILGTWQLNKSYNNKKNNLILQSYENNPKIIYDITDKLPNLIYAKIYGKEIKNKTIYLEPRTYRGRVGYHEISVFKIKDKFILINKGFSIKKNKDERQIIEDSIEGLLMKIEKPKFFELENDIKNDLWFSLDLSDIKKKFNLELDPFIIYNQNITSKNRKAVLPNIVSKVNHLNYAFTWYFLTLSMCVIFFIYFKKNY